MMFILPFVIELSRYTDPKGTEDRLDKLIDRFETLLTGTNERLSKTHRLVRWTLIVAILTLFVIVLGWLLPIHGSILDMLKRTRAVSKP